jgi:tetratricopeptide (TPR) repeat protein
MIELLLQAERSLTVGQLDAAERLYLQAIGNDPRNSIAVVGLARVALDRGDDRTAYQFAQKALEIDAENAAAQRLVSRLGEVMQYRGEELPTGPIQVLGGRRGDGPAEPTRPTELTAPTIPAAPSTASPKRRRFLGRILGR